MIEGIYHIGEQLRWNLGFPQPNAGGAFAAMIAAALWALVLTPSQLRSAPVKVLCFIIGGISTYCLAMTFSRGAVVALAIALPCCGGLATLKYPSRWLSVTMKLILMFAVLVSLTSIVGLDQRMAPTKIATDGSSTARLELWRGGLQMIHLKPLSGWGVGESGNIYMNWFQRLDGTHKVAGMINSYLHVATERGLPFLALMLFPLLTLILISIQSYLKSDSWNGFYLVSLCVLITFSVANFFSTLWVFKHLWWIPSLTALSLIINCIATGKRSLFRTSLTLSFAASTTLIIGVFAASAFAAFTSPVSQINNGFLVLGSPHTDKQVFLVDGDESVLGEDYGKRVRELRHSNICIFAPIDKSATTPPDQKFNRIIYSGNRQPMLIPDTGAEVVFLNPLFDPPRTFASNRAQVILGTLRPPQKQLPWIQSAKANGWQLNSIKGASQSLTHVWPSVLLNSAYD